MTRSTIKNELFPYFRSNVSQQRGVVGVLGPAERCWCAAGGGREEGGHSEDEQRGCLSQSEWGEAGILLGRWACSPARCCLSRPTSLHQVLHLRSGRDADAVIPNRSQAATLWIVQKHTEAIRRKICWTDAEKWTLTAVNYIIASSSGRFCAPGNSSD